MLAKRIIPCLDVKGGRVVKGTRFVDLQDAGDPVDLAKRYNDEGADELVFLDISATQEDRKATLDLVERCAEQLFIPLTVGGGMRSLQDAKEALRAGADKVAVNTAAVETPDLIRELSETFGSQAVVIAIDALKVPNGWTVVTRAGTQNTALDAIGWAKTATDLGAGEILLTCIDRDGTNSGFACDLTRAVSEATCVPVIASGGAGSAQDFARVLKEGNADAALAASIFHRRECSIAQLKDELRDMGVPVRSLA